MLWFPPFYVALRCPNLPNERAKSTAPGLCRWPHASAALFCAKAGGRTGVRTGKIMVALAPPARPFRGKRSLLSGGEQGPGGQPPRPAADSHDSDSRAYSSVDRCTHGSDNFRHTALPRHANLVGIGTRLPPFVVYPSGPRVSRDPRTSRLFRQSWQAIKHCSCNGPRKREPRNCLPHRWFWEDRPRIDAFSRAMPVPHPVLDSYDRLVWKLVALFDPIPATCGWRAGPVHHRPMFPVLGSHAFCGQLFVLRTISRGPTTAGAETTLPDWANRYDRFFATFVIFHEPIETGTSSPPPTRLVCPSGHKRPRPLLTPPLTAEQQIGFTGKAHGGAA